jgi:hypothetical protein
VGQRLENSRIESERVASVKKARLRSLARLIEEALGNIINLACAAPVAPGIHLTYRATLGRFIAAPPQSPKPGGSMTLRDFLDEAGLMPEVAGITGPLDGWRRDDLLARMPTNKIETRLQGALHEPLYPLALIGDVAAVSFTYPSRVFLIETGMGSEIAFDVDRAMECAPADQRAELVREFERRVPAIRKEPMS